MRIRTFAAAAVLAASISVPGVAAAADDSPVVAVVNGEKVHRSEVEAAQANLPPQYQKVPFDQIYPMLLTSVIDNKLVAADARAQKLDQEPAFQARLEWLKDQLLERYAVRKKIEAAVTDASNIEHLQETEKSVNEPDVGESPEKSD